jgi:hypothetical protein
VDSPVGGVVSVPLLHRPHPGGGTVSHELFVFLVVGGAFSLMGAVGLFGVYLSRRKP